MPFSFAVHDGHRNTHRYTYSSSYIIVEHVHLALSTYDLQIQIRSCCAISIMKQANTFVAYWHIERRKHGRCGRKIYPVG